MLGTGLGVSDERPGAGTVTCPAQHTLQQSRRGDGDDDRHARPVVPLECGHGQQYQAAQGRTDDERVLREADHPAQGRAAGARERGEGLGQRGQAGVVRSALCVGASLRGGRGRIADGREHQTCVVHLRPHG